MSLPFISISMCLQNSFMCVISSFNFCPIVVHFSQEQLDRSVVRVKENVISGPTFRLNAHPFLAEISAHVLIRGNYG